MAADARLSSLRKPGQGAEPLAARLSAGTPAEATCYVKEFHCAAGEKADAADPPPLQHGRGVFSLLLRILGLSME
jgi:hypothetical protein